MKDTKNKRTNKLIVIVTISSAINIALFSGLLFTIYHLQTVNSKLKESTSEVKAARQSADKSAQAHWNCLYGGADDKWFEENARTRTGQPEDLLQLADEIGLKHIRKINLAYIDNVVGENTVGLYHQGQGAHGNSSDKDGRTIHIFRGLSYEEKKTFLAHEYLHYIWFNSAALQWDNTLEARLMGMYANNWQLRDRLTGYANRGMLNLTELFSYACTEFSDRYVDKYIIDQCNKWVNRSKLHFIY